MAAATGRDRDGERGTASIELIAVLPFLLLALAVAAQLAIAGQALWSASVAARAGARAALVGGDPRSRRRGGALPPSLRDGARVGEDDGVAVEVPVPGLVPRLPAVLVSARTGWGQVDRVTSGTGDGRAGRGAARRCCWRRYIALQLLAAGYALTLADGAAEAGALALASGRSAVTRPRGRRCRAGQRTTSQVTVERRAGLGPAAAALALPGRSAERA